MASSEVLVRRRHKRRLEWRVSGSREQEISLVQHRIAVTASSPDNPWNAGGVMGSVISPEGSEWNRNVSNRTLKLKRRYAYLSWEFLVEEQVGLLRHHLYTAKEQQHDTPL